MGILSQKFAIKNYIVDKNGFRNHEEKWKDPELNQKDILIFLGDSFTFGKGVKEGENFESLVSEKKKEFISFNIGDPGSDTNRQIKFFYNLINSSDKLGINIKYLVYIINRKIVKFDISK